MKMVNLKKYLIWFIVWISFLWWYAFASNWTIGDLFTKVWTEWKLIGSNIQNWTVWANQLSNNSVDNNKINNSSVYTIAGLTVNWTARANSFLYTSDERYKENISTITDSIDKVSSLRWVDFDWKESGKKDIWFIAQEVEQVLPELVYTNENWYKSVQYWNIVWLLVEAIKEQQKQIDLLEKKLNNK